MAQGPQPTNVTHSQNFILTTVPRVAGYDPSSPGYTANDVMQTIQYFDGLGRLIQTVQLKASPTGRDIVLPAAYDQYGREAVKYLPYSILPTNPSDGSYKAVAVADQASFYADPTNTSTWNAPGVVSTGFANSTTSFEVSPLNRPIDQGAPGDAWQLAGTPGAINPGHTVKIVYATNDATTLTSGTGFWAKNYNVTYLFTFDGHYLSKNNIADLGTYPVDQLYVTVTKSENWTSNRLNTTEEYKDALGRIILKRTFNHNATTGLDETLSTYYVYDSFGNLTYVLPPGANPDAGGITQSTLDTWCYQYRYDGRNRLVEKKIPGKGWELTLYNLLDKPVATQDSVQRMKSPQEFTIIKYDAMERPILTGIYQYTGSTAGTDYRATLQTLIDAQTSEWENLTNSGNGYTANTWPTTWTTTLTLNYYDNYTTVPAGLPYSYTSGSNMTRGQIAATKTAVLNTPTDMLWAQHYYDDQNRPIKSFQQHYLGGTVSVNNYDVVTKRYNFTGQVTTSNRQHFNIASPTIPLVTIANRYVYDNVGRKRQAFEQINGGTNVLLSQTEYNEIGQLYQKKLHSEDNGTNFIEPVIYSYNPRGWSTEISSTNFDEKLYYDNPSGTISGLLGLYNGNIIESRYNSPSVVNKGFSYIYDNLSRLTSSKYYSLGTYNGTMDETASYDIMGNMNNLVRGSYGAISYIYSGTFAYGSYNGNQVGTITNNGSSYRTYSYDGNGNTTNNGGYSFDYNMLNLPLDVKQSGTVFNTYIYDANGQKLRKVSTASGNTDYISGIQYKNGALDFVANEAGRYAFNGGSPTYEYDMKDHLGNVRVMIQKNTATSATAIQEQEYYAFGLNHTLVDNSTNNKYLYNTKEMQDESGLNQLDYGARFYDPIIARWNTVDPLAEVNRRWNPYTYALDNPIRNIDPDGMNSQDAVDDDLFLQGEAAKKAFANFQQQMHQKSEAEARKQASIRKFINNTEGQNGTDAWIGSDDDLDEPASSNEIMDNILKSNTSEVKPGQRGAIGGPVPWYGNFLGPGPDGNPFTLIGTDGKILKPIDMLDEAAQDHDYAYFKAHTGGIKGALFNKTVKEADLRLAAAAQWVIFFHLIGQNDRVSGKPISSAELRWAWAVMISFGDLSTLKRL